MFMKFVLILLSGITKAEKQPILTGSSDLAMEGENYTLSCNVTTRDVYWTRNGLKLYRLVNFTKSEFNLRVNTSNYKFSVRGANTFSLTIKNISYQAVNGVKWTCEYWYSDKYNTAEYVTTVGVAISTVSLTSRQVNEMDALVIEDGAMFQISCSTPFAYPKPVIKMCVSKADSVLQCTLGNVHLADNNEYVAEFNDTATPAMDNHLLICNANNSATIKMISSNEVSMLVLPNEYIVKNHTTLVLVGSAGGSGFIIIVITVILGGIIYKRRRTAKEIVASNRMSASQQNQHNRQNVLNQGTEQMEPIILENDMYVSADVWTGDASMNVDKPGHLSEGPVYGKVHKTSKQGQPTAEETSVPVYGTVNKNKTTDSISEAIDGPVYGVVNKRSKTCSKTETVSIHGERC